MVHYVNSTTIGVPKIVSYVSMWQYSEGDSISETALEVSDLTPRMKILVFETLVVIISRTTTSGCCVATVNTSGPGYVHGGVSVFVCQLVNIIQIEQIRR